MRPVNQLPLSLIEMKRSPLASSRNPDSPPKPRKLEVRISPLRYSREPNRTRARSRVSKEGIGRALTSIETGAATENSSGEGCFGGGCVASCARAICGTAADKSPAAVDFRKRRREKCGGSFLMVRRRACAVSNHEDKDLSHPSRRGQRVRAKRGPMINSDAAPQDEAVHVREGSSHSTNAICAGGPTLAQHRGSR